MKKIIIPAILLIASITGIVYVLNNNKEKNNADIEEVAKTNSAVSVRAEKATYDEVSNQYVVNGVFAPKQEVMLSAETGGRVTRVLVKEGDYVRAGQTLAIIDGDKQNVGVANAQAVYNTAKAEVTRFESAYKSGGVTKQQLDQVKLQLENAKNNLRSAQLNASDVNVTASFSGIINLRSVEPGSFASPGHPLFEIVDVSSLKFKVNIDEKNVAYLKKGQQIEVVANTLPDQKFVGVVSFIAPKAGAGLNFPVELEIKNNANQDLKAGMYGTAYIGAEKSSNALVIPRNAFGGSVSSNEIFVVKEGKAVATKVVTGRTFGDKIEIISGIDAGTEVITSGQINLSDGTPVQIIK